MNERPTKPLMVYDGDCGFCRRWVERWRRMTGDSIEYASFDEAGTRFGELDRGAVHLVEPSGRQARGAAAVFRGLSVAGRHRWLGWLYRHSGAFAAVSERAYTFVARHRGGLAKLDRWTFGPEPPLPSYVITRGLFLRLLGVIYLIAFLSLWVQVQGLIGSHGILPVGDFVELLHRAQYSFWKWPTLCWFDSSDRFLTLLCASGVVASVLLILGVLPLLTTFLAWLAYLSLSHVGQDFLSFQWDALLLEAGFLAIFLAPWQWRLSLKRPSEPSHVMIWLVRWLLFKVMFLSAVVKWTSGDVTWQGLSAMSYHYETQPLPVWTSWYAHWQPGWLLVLSTLGVFIAEGFVPLLYLTPRRLRFVGFWLTVLFQCLIMATGNFGFFNLLTIVLGVSLLDDQAFPTRWWRRVKDAVGTRPVRRRRWPAWVVAPVAVVLFAVGLTHLVEAFGVDARWGWLLSQGRSWTGRFEIDNPYGLFRVMTTERPEILIEGSNDGVNWRAYEFKWKPTDPMRPPGYCIPHMPRLDWQMWFAALGPRGQLNWLVPFMRRLTEGEPAVLRLMGKNPFPEGPPRYVRAVMWDYHFTDPAQKHATGAWWRRHELGELLRVEREEARNSNGSAAPLQ